MSAVSIVVLVVVIAAVALAAGTVSVLAGRMALRRRFGTEYDRLVRDVGRRQARAEIAQRRRRVADLGLKPLAAERRAGYEGRWNAAQEGFIDSPSESVRTAAALVVSVAADRGYLVADAERLLTDLSVYHARRLNGYRQARRTTERASVASTEELRQALLGHRALFRELIGASPSTGRHVATRRRLRPRISPLRAWRGTLAGIGRTARRRVPERLPALRGER